ncbi:expressed unknown protein (Partial), partial [Seminavis robusta]
RPEDYSEDRRRDDRYAGSRHSRREEYPRQHEDRRYEGRRGYGEDDYGSRHAEDGQGNERPSGVSPFASAASSDGKDEAPEREVHIDIGFGTKARLRRTKETMDAIARDFYAPCVCVACSTDLFCIADVKFIVCPKCKTISPADAAATGEGGTATSFNGSPIERRDVGLGFTYDTLYKMQSDVARERDGRRKVAF